MKKETLILFMLSAFLAFPIFHSYAQNDTKFHGDVDSSPIESVIMINEDQNKTVFFQPNTVTI